MDLNYLIFKRRLDQMEQRGLHLQFQRSLAREMRNKLVLDVLKRGFDPDMVRNAVEQHLWKHRRGFSSKWKLAHAVLDLEKEEEWFTNIVKMLSEDLRDHGLQDQFPVQSSLDVEMQSQVVSDVLKRGYRRHRVQKAVEQHLWEHGRGFSSKWELAHAVLDLEKEEEAEERRMFPRLLGLSQMRNRGLGTPQVHKRDIDPGEQYKSEQRRLDSYITWPDGAPIQPWELAKAGFFYTGSVDRVQCFCCKGILRDWEVGDRAMNKHHKHFPSCQFVLNSNVGNVPIEGHDPRYGDTAMGERERLHPHGDFVNGQETRSNPGEQYKSKQRRLDFMERHLYDKSAQVRDKPDCMPTSACQGFVSKNVLLPNANTGHDITGPGPGTPQVQERSIDPGEQYKSEQRRLDSFATWPTRAPIQPQELAKAGFFYTGSDDRVQCFCCQGILRNWEVGDRAMNEHRRHFSSCLFVQNSNVGNVPIKNQDPKYGDTAKGERERLHPHGDFVNGRETRNKPLPTPSLFPAPVTQAAAAPPTPAGRHYTDFLSRAQQDKLMRKQADPNLWRPPSVHQSIPASPQASLSSGLYQPGLQPPTHRESGRKHPQMADDCVEGVQAHFPNQQQQVQHMTPPDEAGTGKNLLEMGFEPNMVWNAVQQHVQDHGRGFASAHNLEGIVAVLDLEEKKEERMEISGPSQMGTGGFRSHTQKLREERLENGSDTATGDATYLQDFFYMSERKCKMCMEAEIDIAFIPCGHFTVSVWTYSFHCTMGPGLHTKCANGTVAGFSS